MEANTDNASSQSQSKQLEGEDRLSTLTDDILPSILGRVSTRMAATTSVLSTRWMHLPWLLPELSINVKEFLSGPCRDPAEENDMDQAMTSLTKATWSFLAKPQKGSSISRLRLQLYLTNTFLCNIGPLVGDAVNSGLLKDLDLTIHDEICPLDRSKEEMIQRAKEMDGFFSAYPIVLRCLTRLCLYNVCFGELDINHVLFDCCEQLKHLTLYHSDTGSFTPCKIDAPNSKLSVLEIDTCSFEKLELVCLPKLERLEWNTWVSVCAPLSFGFVPSLGELILSYGRAFYHRGFKLSEVLDGATGIHTLTLDFQGENLWMQPELKELCPAFRKIRNLSVRGIFVYFDIEWTIAFLEAAPSVEILLIGVWDHECESCDGGEKARSSFPERRNPRWEMDFHNSKNLLLKELQFIGFASFEHQFTFIRALLERAPNLQTIVLKGNEQCDQCDALDAPPFSLFPKEKDEQEMVVGELRMAYSRPK
uniref:Uncharacterized protein n=1 Tax=Avena sativa TaxID=4498 RepID=A0ACD5UID1_AVESA